MDHSKAQGNVEEFHLPEWETSARHRAGQKSGLKERAFLVFDRVMPGHRKYLGASRKTACIAILVILVVLLALILGLAIGLSKKSRYTSVPALRLTLIPLTFFAQPTSKTSLGITDVHRRSHLLRSWSRRLWCYVLGYGPHCIHQPLHLRRCIQRLKSEC